MAAWDATTTALATKPARSSERVLAPDAVDGALSTVRTTPLVQLLSDAAQLATALARSYQRRTKPTRRGRLHRV